MDLVYNIFIMQSIADDDQEGDGTNGNIPRQACLIRPVGFVLGDAHTRPITRAATVLSNMRWAASFAYHAGATFSSGEVWFFVPVGSSGRWATQAIVQSPNTFTYSGISLQTMTGTSTYQSWTGTSATLANPTDLRGTSSGTWW